METAFDEILVGERGRAHDVLASTLPNDIARSLAHHLDLPGQIPPGFELDNYVSGFPNADGYVVARTNLDASAARQGMVFSHALIADKVAIGEMQNIAAVFQQLKRTRPEAPFASKTLIDTSEKTVERPPPPTVCDMLTISSDCPVVIANPLALEGLISALWPRLLPSIRRELQFRLSFGPEESGIAKLHIVAVPTVTLSRWPVGRVAEPTNELQSPQTAAGAFLCGQFRGDLDAFLGELSIDCKTFETLGLAARALELIRSERGFEKTLVAARLIGTLQLEPSKGAAIKKSLLNQLANQPGPTSVQEFVSLRNLDLAPFQEKAAFVASITQRFLRLFETNAGADALSPVVQSAFEPSQATKDWRNACCAALAQLSNAGATSIAPLVWIMLSKHTRVGLFLVENVASVGCMDSALVACLDEAPQLNSVEVSAALINAGFVRAETGILINRHDGLLVDALKEACQRDRKRYGHGAIKHILDQLKPPEIVIAAFAVDDPIVSAAAARAVASEPTLLSTESLTTPQVQRLWSTALRHNDRAWRIRPDIDALRNEVFDIYLSGELPSDLLARLVFSPLGNALRYPRRADLWRALPRRFREECLAATAHAWAKSLPESLSKPGYVEPEHELAVSLASSRMLQDMEMALKRLNLTDVLKVFSGKRAATVYAVHFGLPIIPPDQSASFR